MNPNFMLDHGHKTVNRQVADQVIANWLREHRRDTYHLTNVTAGAENSTRSYFVASILDDMGTIMLQGQADTEHKAVAILATKIAAIQLPVTELAFILDWMTTNPVNTDILINPPETGSRYWRGLIGIGDDGTDVISSQEDSIVKAIQSLAESLLAYLDKQPETESENSHGD